MNQTDREHWIKSSEQLPEENVSVLVYIPEEDGHITTGMWDCSKKWVLLDEYRVPISEVTYWRQMVDKPSDDSYTPTTRTEDEENTSSIIRTLQKKIFVADKQLEELRAELEGMRSLQAQTKRDFLKENAELKAELEKTKLEHANTIQRLEAAKSMIILNTRL